MRREFDNDNYHLPTTTTTSTTTNINRSLLTIVLTLAIVLFVFTTSSMLNGFTPQQQPITPTTKPQVDKSIPLYNDLTKYSKDDIAHIKDLYQHLVGPTTNTSTTTPKSSTTTKPTTPHIDPKQQQPTQPPTTIPTPKKQPSAPQPPPITTTPTKTEQQPHQSHQQQKLQIPPLFEGHEIIVTLTTIPDRMPYLNATLLSLVAQTVPPTEIVLNIPYVSRRFFNPDGTPLVYDLPIDFIEYINALGNGGAVDDGSDDDDSQLIDKNQQTTTKTTKKRKNIRYDALSVDDNDTTAQSLFDTQATTTDPTTANPTTQTEKSKIAFPFSLSSLSRIPKITIHRCDDDGPATKLLPTLAREFSIGRLDSLLMIADDDVIYPPNHIESMVGYYLSKPELHYSAVGARGYCSPPSNVWEWRIVSQIAFSGQQLYNITQHLNNPYHFDNPVTLEQYDGENTLDLDENGVVIDQDAPDLGLHSTLLSPNAHRFIFRPYNYTSVQQTGGRSVYDLSNEWPNIQTNISLNPEWSFSHLFDPTHPSYYPNPYHKHTDDGDQMGTFNDIYNFIGQELGYNHLYKPISTPIESILPHVVHKQEYMSHSPVDVITGNNGFLLRPYYFLRYSPFIGNVTRFDVETYTEKTFQQFQQRHETYAYTTHNSYFDKVKKFYAMEYDNVVKRLKHYEQLRDNEQNQQKVTGFSVQSDDLDVLDDASLPNNQQNDQNQQQTTKNGQNDEASPQLAKIVKFDQAEYNALSEYRKRIHDTLTRASAIQRDRKIAEEAAIKAKLAQKDGKSTIGDSKSSFAEHIHPELESRNLTIAQYHIEHRKLHAKLDFVDQDLYKQSHVVDQHSLDLDMMYKTLGDSHGVNIVQFGKFPEDLDEYKDNVMNDPDFLPPNKPGPYDFSEDTRSAGVLGSNGQPLPESVYYMDDIWFNGILAANGVSRVVVSLTVDPVHRPKMQEATTTLEQVPIGRSFHNNVLFKAFEQYWTNCPHIVTNVTIPSFYLKYYAFSDQSLESKRAEAMNELNKKRKKVEPEEPVSFTDDYRNHYSNPWAGWGVPDNETNVGTQYYYYTAQRSPITTKPPTPPPPANTNSNSPPLTDGDSDDDFEDPETKVGAANVGAFFKYVKQNQTKTKKSHDDSI